MSKGLIDKDNNITEKLARFTDLVLANRVVDTSTLDETDMLRDLQAVILEIYQSVPQVTPDQELVTRIHRNLIQALQKETSRKETIITQITKHFPLRQTGWQSTSQRRRRVAVQIALGFLIILAFMIPLMQTQDSLPGAAIGNNGLVTVILILLIAGSVTAWYLWRRKK